MSERAPHVLMLLTHRYHIGYFIALGGAIERLGARVSYLSTDYSIERRARALGVLAPNVMHTRLGAGGPVKPSASVSLEDVTRYVIDNPTLDVNRPTLFAQADRLLRAYAAHFDRLRPDLVVGWSGTRPRARAAMKLAESRGIATLYFEQGSFPNTTVADPKGVNWEGSMRGFEVPRRYDRARIERWLEEFRARSGPAHPAESDARKVRAEVVDAVLNFFTRRSPFHPTLYFDHDRRAPQASLFRHGALWLRSKLRFRATAQEEMRALPERFVFLPLQVHDDMQVIVHSPRIRTMEELVDATIEALPEGWSLVVKSHPLDEARRNYDVLSEMLEGERFRFVHRANTLELIRRSGAVVTLNSTVGLEALAFFKPVVVLGDAVYAGRGFTVDVPDPEELPAKLPEALRFRPDEDEVKRFLDYLVFEYSKPGEFRNPSPADLETMAEYVVSQARPAR